MLSHKLFARMAIGLSAIASVSAAHAADVVIPLAVPTSGPDAPLADPLVKGYKLAIKTANAAGNLPGRVIPDIQDDQDKPEVASSLARRWCGNNQVIGVVGNMASSLVLASSPIYESCGLTHVTPTASNDTLTTKGWHYFYRACSRNADQGNQAVAWIRKNWPQVKTISTVDSNDSSSRNYADAFASAWKAAGGQVISQGHVVAGSGDFRGALTGMLAQKPDLIVVGVFDTDGGILIKQARELGYAGKLFGSDGDATPNLINIAGATAAVDLHVTNLGLDPSQEPGARQFTEAYKKEYGEAPSAYAASAYDSTMLLIHAWKAAGGSADREKVHEAVANGTFNGLFGSFQFNSKGDLSVPLIGVYRVQNGKFEYVGKSS